MSFAIGNEFYLYLVLIFFTNLFRKIAKHHDFELRIIVLLKIKSSFLKSFILWLIKTSTRQIFKVYTMYMSATTTTLEGIITGRGVNFFPESTHRDARLLVTNL